MDFFIFQTLVITSHHGRGIIRAPKENKKTAEKGKRKEEKRGEKKEKEKKKKNRKTTPAALFFFLQSCSVHRDRIGELIIEHVHFNRLHPLIVILHSKPRHPILSTTLPKKKIPKRPEPSNLPTNPRHVEIAMLPSKMPPASHSVLQLSQVHKNGFSGWKRVTTSRSYQNRHNTIRGNRNSAGSQCTTYHLSFTTIAWSKRNKEKRKSTVCTTQTQ